MVIARILKPRGVKGEVTARALSDLPGAYTDLGEVLLIRPGWERLCRVEMARTYAKKVILRFSGVNSYPEAQELCGSTVSRPALEFVDAGPDSYYISQLIGCLVELPDGTILGEVGDVITTGGTDVLSVRTPRGEVLVPFTRSICIRIDPEQKRIQVDPPDGLLKINAV